MGMFWGNAAKLCMVSLCEDTLEPVLACSAGTGQDCRHITLLVACILILGGNLCDVFYCYQLSTQWQEKLQFTGYLHSCKECYKRAYMYMNVCNDTADMGKFGVIKWLIGSIQNVKKKKKEKKKSWWRKWAWYIILLHRLLRAKNFSLNDSCREEKILNKAMKWMLFKRNCRFLTFFFLSKVSEDVQCHFMSLYDLREQPTLEPHHKSKDNPQGSDEH